MKRTSRSTGRRWSARVTRESHPLDLRSRVFKQNDPRRIAASLKRSAERSHHRQCGLESPRQRGLDVDTASRTSVARSRSVIPETARSPNDRMPASR